MKALVLVALMALAALAAAVFGAAHNQLSYSVGPTYFTELKFGQLAIPADMSPRSGAAWAGIRAGWWAGVLAGLPAFGLGLAIVPRARTYFAAGVGAIGTVAFVALCAALAGLLGGIAADSTGWLDAWLTFPEGPARGDFLRAGFMHAASYPGVALGALAAILPMARARRIDLMAIDAARARRGAVERKTDAA